MKTAPWQTPWTMTAVYPGPWSQEVASGGLWRLAQRRAFRRCLILIGADDGHWREDRVVERDDGWYATSDSHRTSLSERALPPPAAPHLAALFEHVRQLIEAPPPSALQRGPGWLDDGPAADQQAVPVCTYTYGGAASIVRGFGVDRWLWSLIDPGAAAAVAPGGR